MDRTSLIKLSLFRLEFRSEIGLAITDLETWVAKEKSDKVLDNSACFSKLLAKLQSLVHNLVSPLVRRNLANQYIVAMSQQIELFLKHFKWGSTSHHFKSLAQQILELANSNSELAAQDQNTQNQEPVLGTSLFDLVPCSKIIEQPLRLMLKLVQASIEKIQDWSCFDETLYNLVSSFRIAVEPHLDSDQEGSLAPLTQLLKQTYFQPLIKSQILDPKTQAKNQSWINLWQSIELEQSDIEELIKESNAERRKTADVKIQTTPPQSPVLRRISSTAYSQPSTGLPSQSQTPHAGQDKSRYRGDIITSSFESIAFEDLPLQSQASQYSSASQSEISSRDLWTNSMNEEIRSIKFKPEPIKKKKKKRTHHTPDKREKKEYQTPQRISEKQRLSNEQQQLMEAQLLLLQSPKRVFSNQQRLVPTKEEPCKVLFPESQIS